MKKNFTLMTNESVYDNDVEDNLSCVINHERILEEMAIDNPEVLFCNSPFISNLCLKNESKIYNFIGSFFIIIFYSTIFVDEYYFDVNTQNKLIGFSLLLEVEIFSNIACWIENNILGIIAFSLRKIILYAVLIGYQSYFFMTTLEFSLIHSFIFGFIIFLFLIVLIFDEEKSSPFVANLLFLAILLSYIIYLAGFISSIIFGHVYISIVSSILFGWHTFIFIKALYELHFISKLLVINFFIVNIFYLLIIILTEIQKQFYLKNPSLINKI